MMKIYSSYEQALLQEACDLFGKSPRRAEAQLQEVFRKMVKVGGHTNGNETDRTVAQDVFSYCTEIGGARNESDRRI